MTSRNPTKTDTKTSNAPQDDSTPKAGDHPEVKRELTDAEIASVSGGGAGLAVPPPRS